MKEYKFIFVDNGSKNGELAYIGGKSFLPNNIMWPKNPNGNNLILLMTIPTTFLNKYFNNRFIQDRIISIFTTYDAEDYFLDSIVYNGSDEELNNIKEGFTKVIFHDIGDMERNECEFEIPNKVFELELTEGDGEYGGSKLGGKPYLLQKNGLKLENYEFILQIYGNDFPEGYNDIFYLSDSLGYLYLNKNDNGIFFTQCT